MTFSEIHEIALEVLGAVDEACPITEEVWDTFYIELVKATRHLRGVLSSDKVRALSLRDAQQYQNFHQE